MVAVAPAPARALVLIGFMGAGKSTVAAELASALGVTASDSDALLTDRLGHSIAAEIERADADGERSFRAAEEELVCELLDGAQAGAVIALGGGSVLSERVRNALEPHLTVLLDTDPALDWERVSSQDGAAARPFARDRDRFLELHRSRRDLYEELADAFLPALPLGAAERTLGALKALSHAPGGSRLAWARSASGEYPVLIGRGLLAAWGRGELGEYWPVERPGSRRFCVSDETVWGSYGGSTRPVAAHLELAPGEESKTLVGAERVWRALLSAGMTRADHVVALGGGVVGDLAGFCAATYQRGVPVVQAPTTLLAQVDSAYGGKTGVDLPEAKNYIGAYHQPAGVIVDVDTLATLPPRELAAGWVEVLKTALIAGGTLWETVSAGAEVDERTILACARAKLAIVAADERDGGARQALNLGHTVGHAIETATGYSRYRHGEAVGLGLLAALRLSGLQDLRTDVRELLLARGLPVSLDGTLLQAVLEAIPRDKKRLHGEVPFVLLERPGDVRIGCEVNAGELRAAVMELSA
jgi:shikimate kinase/3-dehydroquinate synthase